MRANLLAAALMLLGHSLAHAQETKKPEEPAPKPARAEQFKSLHKDFTGRLEKVAEDVEDTEAKLSELVGRQTELGEEYVTKLLELADADPKDEVALDALDHALRDQLDYLSEEQATAIFELLTKHHAASEKVLPICELAAELELTDSGKAFLNSVIAKNKNAEARAWALYALATAKYTEADDANDARRFKESETLFERVVKEIPADATEGTPVDAAQRYLFELKNLMVGQKAPDFATEDLDGKPVKLSSQKGKATVVLFWATWCEFCAELHPQLKELVARHPNKLAVVNISGDDDVQTVTEYLEEKPLPGVHWWNGPEGGVLDQWNVQGFPTLYVIDASGIIRHRNIRDEELAKAIETLLKPAEPKK